MRKSSDNTEKPDLLFLANSFHLTVTGSSLFFIDLLKKDFEVTIVPHKFFWEQYRKRKWDVLVSWQHIYSPEELDAFGVQNTILVPMWDDCPHDTVFWSKYKKYKAISFCESLHHVLCDSGVISFFCRYYPLLPNTMIPKGLKKGFFWLRNSSVDWSLIRTIFIKLGITKVHVHHGKEISSISSITTSDDKFRFEFTESNWFENREDYMSCLSTCDVFVAPRLSEGIGMSFLESMALGQCVIAYDAPTMNEYIQHGVNGFLLGKEISRFDVESLGACARQSVIEGRKEWENTSIQIADFIISDSLRVLKKRHFLRMVKRTQYMILFLARKLKSLFRK